MRDPEGLKNCFDEYYRYLQSVRKSLPPSAFAFANAPWHYDYSDHKCPHDAWVESLNINELSSGERSQYREIEINVRLLGAYHDGHIELLYKKALSYSLTSSAEFKMSPLGEGHGDWLIDEIRLSERGFVLHEINFSKGGNWIIECTDIDYKWIPFK
jgi:hypothetical protein